MPQVKKIVVSAGGVFSVGDHENAQRSVTLEAELKADESIEDAYIALMGIANVALANEICRLVDRQIDHNWLQEMSEMGPFSEQRIVRHVQGRPSFAYLRLLSPALAEDLVEETVRLYSPPAPEPEPDDSLKSTEPDYTGDGFTEEHDDGYPNDAHPDEVEYEKMRAYYPDLPPYSEDEMLVERESIPFAEPMDDEPGDDLGSEPITQD